MSWWRADRGQISTGKASGSGCKQPDPPSGNGMRASQKSKRNKAKANPTLAYGSSTLSMATHNLVNMVAITLVSGTVLLALLAANHF